MVERTDPVPEDLVDEKSSEGRFFKGEKTEGFFIAVLDDVKELVEKYVVNENDKLRLLQQIEKLDDDSEHRIRETIRNISRIDEY